MRIPAGNHGEPGPAHDPGPDADPGPGRTGGRPRVVALGGGHGLHVMLGALRGLDADLTAVVTVADDGGSSGRLRREVPDIVPPGDLRMALSALADEDDGSLWARTFQHRFGGEGALTGHPVGNIVLVGLMQVLGDPVAALDAAAAVLGVRGRVLPMSVQPLEIVAEVSGVDEDPAAVRRIRGQVAVASTPGRVRSVQLEPAGAPACPAAVTAIHDADLVVLGPGSWFTSVLPHLLLTDLADALTDTSAHRLVVLNLAPQPGETEGFSPEQHLDVLSEHAPGFRIDTVLADRAAVVAPDRLDGTVQRLGARLVLADVAATGEPRHDPQALRAALRPLVDQVRRSAGGQTPGDRQCGESRERATSWR